MKMKKKGAWSEEEDQKLAEFIKNQGVEGFNWEAISHMAGLNRCGKSCRLRWKNYLSPHIRRGNFSKGEESIIIQLQKHLGNKWSQIAAELPGRTDNDIKNFWNTKLRKKLKQKAKTEYSAHSQTPTTDIQTFLANYPMSTFNILPCFVNMPQSQVAHNLLLQEVWEREQQAEVVIAPTPNYYHNFLTILQPGYAFGNELYNLNGAIPFEFQTNSSSDAWFGGGLSENSLDSNAVGMCSNNDLTECHMPPDPLVSAATDDEISMSMTDEFYVNPNSVASSDYEWIPYEMNYEFPDMQQKEILASFLGLSPSLMDNASSSKLYDGASYSFYDDLQS